jgi:hypothetical protein
MFLWEIKKPLNFLILPDKPEWLDAKFRDSMMRVSNSQKPITE